MSTVELETMLAEQGLGRVAKSLASMARRCGTYASGSASPLTTSKLGGRPWLPADFEWPRRQKPLTFVGQFELDGIADELEGIDLPTTGIFSYFYDYEQMPWGFDPKDVGGGRLFYFPDMNLLEETTPPEAIEFDDWFRETHLAPSVGYAFPDVHSDAVVLLEMSDEEEDAYYSLTGVETQCRHQLGGYPAIIQNPMELECQFASNGIYCGDGNPHKDPRASQLAEGAEDWQLLLQIDSDDDADLMWGDCGRLYVWIRRQDLATRRFDKTWTILQCY
jgi:uncharacterized protein YwqG